MDKNLKFWRKAFEDLGDNVFNSSDEAYSYQRKQKGSFLVHAIPNTNMRLWRVKKL